MEYLNFLKEHYSESVKYCKVVEKERNNRIIHIGIAIIFYSFFCFEESLFCNIFNQTINHYFEITISVENNKAMLMFLFSVVLLYLTGSYFQKCIYVEKQYPYFEYLETEITNISKISITRESKAYISEFPRISEYFGYIYKFIFPFLILGITIYSFFNTWNYLMICRSFFGFGGLILWFLTILQSILYLVFQINVSIWYSKESENKEKKITF